MRRRGLLVAAASGFAPALASAQVAPRASLPSDLAAAARNAEICSADNVKGAGLRGEYFAGARPSGDPLLTRTDATIDFDESLDIADPALRARVHSIRWSGWVKAMLPGVYRFHLQVPHAAMTVSNRAVDDATFELAAGRFYPVRIEVVDLPRRLEPFRLEWTAPHGMRYAVPQALLHLPMNNG